MHLGKFPDSTEFQSWKVNFRTEVCSKAKDPRRSDTHEEEESSEDYSQRRKVHYRSHWCDGVHLFVISATCLVCCEWCVRLVIVSVFSTSFLWPCGSRRASQCTLCDFIHVVTEKGISLRLSLLSDISLTCCQCRSEHKEWLQFCGFFSGVHCILVTYSLHKKEQIQQPQSGGGALVVSEEEYLVVNKVPLSEYCSKSQPILMSDCEEDLDDFPTENLKTNRPKLWLDHFAQNQQINGQLQVESLLKFHHSLMGQLPGSSMRSLLMIGWILHCLKKIDDDQHWRTDLSERQKGTKDFSIENLWEQMMASSIFEIRWETTSSRELEMFFLWRFYLLIRARRGNIEMVVWIGKFSLLLRRLKDAWMDMSPPSAMSQERRESQCMAEMAN